MIFVKKITRPQFWEQEFYAEKRVNRDISQFTSNSVNALKSPDMCEFNN